MPDNARFDETIEILHDSFREILLPDTRVTCIAEGFKFTEGPAWRADEGCLLFSDIPGDTIYSWREGKGHQVWRQPSRNANGNTIDREGRLVTCEHGSRTLTRTEPDGSVTTLAETYAGKKLNSPNDVVVQRDGTIWFTDPPYGIKPDQSEQDANYVFRLDPGSEELVPVAGDFSRPNGLCFSPDETLLYIADSDTSLNHIRVFRVQPDKTLEGGEIFAVIEPGVPDGIRVDCDGRLYSTAGDGVQVFAPDGALLGKLHTSETSANCTFGGPENRTLFFTATTRIWMAQLRVAGAK
jgi:gluconolactonase